jgi:hypothetical protein
MWGKHSRGRPGDDPRLDVPTADEVFGYRASTEFQPGRVLIPGVGDDERRQVQEALDANLGEHAPRVVLEDEEVDLGEAHLTQGADGAVHVTLDTAFREGDALDPPEALRRLVDQWGEQRVRDAFDSRWPGRASLRAANDALDGRPSLYVSGTISSDPDLSFEEAKARFDAVRDYLEALGYRAVSPVDMEGECGRTPEECVGEQRMVMPGQGQGNHSWECYLRGDIRAMLLCDGVAVLPNWQRSKGAFLEVQTALGCGMDVRDYGQWPLVRPEAEGWVGHGEVQEAFREADEVQEAFREADEVVDQTDGGVTATSTCRQCGRGIGRGEDGLWLDDGRNGLRAYCPSSIDPDPVHVPLTTADM